MLQDMRFEELWSKIPADQKDKFIAYQVYLLEKRVSALEVKPAFAGGITGGLSGAVSAGIIIAVNYIGQKLKLWQ